MTAIETTNQPRVKIPGVVYPSHEHASKYAGLEILGGQTFFDVLLNTAKVHGEKPAVIADNKTLTHNQLNEQTDRLAAALLDMGLKPLDRAVMHIEDTPTLLVAFIGSIKAGIIPICTLAAHREHEISQIATQASAKLIWSQGKSEKFDYVDFAERMCKAVPTLEHIIVAEPTEGDTYPSVPSLIASMDAERAKAALAQVVRDPFQVAVFQLSGGTSGTPKIIPRFHSEYIYNIEQSARVLALGTDERLFMPTPMMHNLHVACGWGPVMLSGGCTIISPNVSGDTVARSLAEYMPTRLCIAPPTLAKARQSQHWTNEAISKVRGMLSPFNARLLNEALQVPVYHVFGMTEGVIMYTRDEDSEFIRYETVGRPISEHDEIRILKPDTEIEQTLGEVGELASRGPYTTFGYFDAPERNKEAFTSDGFYRSGDLMRAIEEDGKRYYQFCGRLKDVVDRGGEKINAEEVEQAVMRHGAFMAALVVGVPDPIFTERVCVCVVPRPGAVVPDVTELGCHLQSVGLAKFKWPERIEVIDAVPLTHAGKPDKTALKQKLLSK